MSLERSKRDASPKHLLTVYEVAVAIAAGRNKTLNCYLFFFKRSWKVFARFLWMRYSIIRLCFFCFVCLTCSFKLVHLEHTLDAGKEKPILKSFKNIFLNIS